MVEERFKRRRAVRLLLVSLGLMALLVFMSACGGVGSQRAEEEPSKEEAENTNAEAQASVEKSEVASAETRETGTDLGSPSLGDEDAPVVMMEYAGY